MGIRLARARYPCGIPRVDRIRRPPDNARMGIGLLGPTRIDGEGTLEPRDRVALAVLTVHPGQVVPPDRFADALWGEAPPRSWQKQVQICIGRLRKRLGAGAIETVPGGYRLALDGESLDSFRFERLIERARALAATGEADRAASTYDRALALWRGDPWADLSDWLPVRSEAARLEELRRTAEEDRLEAKLAAGEHREVAIEAEALVTEEPLRERRWAILALARYRCGRQGDALRSLTLARHTLSERLGVDPGPELAALEVAILRQADELAAVPEPASVSAECPYKGLVPYDEGDREWFFGRGTDVAACSERLTSVPLLVVAGPSGCGKSSLVRAGLVPSLRRDGRAVVVLVPGSEPEAAMADAVASVDGVPVLVIDQFEELFTVDRSPEGIRRFFNEIALYARERAPVILAVRSDHLGGLAADASFGRLVERGLFLVSPLDGDRLREAIERPATLAGLRLESGLVDLLIRDAEGEPGAMPLLSYALSETWRRRDGHVLTIEGYQATGGIRGAVARSAERLYDNLPPGQRRILRSVLLRLVAPSTGGDPVRCRLPTQALLGDSDRERVMTLLVRSRLVTADKDTVEVAHESLARAWPRLRSWLEEDAAGQRIQRHLSASADGWESLGRPDSELYRGARLDTALEWREASRRDLIALETAFLEASEVRATSEIKVVEERAQREARQNRRLRASLAATSLFLVFSLIAGLVAIRGGQATRRQRDAARSADQQARIEALVNQSLALRPTDRSVAALLAVEAYRRDPSARTRSALLSTFTAAPHFLGHRYLPTTDLTGALVPGTMSAVVALDGPGLALLDLDTGEVDDRFPGSVDPTRAVALSVSADGRSVAILFPDAFAVYDVASGRTIAGPVPTPFHASDIAIAADGSLVAIAGGYRGDVVWYRTVDGDRMGDLPGLGPPASDPRGTGPTRWDGRYDTGSVTFGSDGTLYAGSMSGPIRAVDPSAPNHVRSVDAPAYSSETYLLLGPDGRLIGGGSNGLVAVNTRTMTLQWSVDTRVGLHPESCPWLAVASNVRKLYCGDHYGVIEERDLTTGRPSGVVLDAQLGSVGELAVTSDGRVLVAFGAEAPVVSRWRLDGSGKISDVVAEGHVAADGYDSTGRMLLVARRPPDATVDPDFRHFAIWDPAFDRSNGSFMPAGGMGWAGTDLLLGYAFAERRIAFYRASSRSIVDGVHIPLTSDHSWSSAGGDRLYVGFTNGEVWTVDPVTRQRVQPTISARGLLMSVSATSDGDRIVVTSATGSGDRARFATNVYEGGTGAKVGDTLIGPSITSVSLDGTLVGALEGTITRYDLATMQPMGSFPAARGEVNSLQFSRDGKVLLATSNDQTVSIYDVASGTRLGDPIPSASPFIVPGFLRPDGDEVVVTEREGVAVWDIDPARMAEAACELAGRNLTQAEWDTYLGALGPYRTTCPASR